MDLQTLRHSTAHVLAAAIKKLYPMAKLGIGPNVENGFYYDFGNLDIKEEDFEAIEKEMKEITKKDDKFVKIKKTRKEAEKILAKEDFKLDLLKDLKDDDITFYESGDFIDLCKGPHLKSTKEIKAFKLLKISGAYWKGDQNNAMLTRIYGTAFENEKELKDYLELLEQAESRNHVRLGKDLDLFVFSDVIGKGLPLLTPKGALIKRLLQEFVMAEETRRGYQFTDTPVLTRTELYKISGHLDHFRESMFIFKIGNEEMALRPMTCPHQFMIYKSKLRSYKELPIRYAEFANLFRNEASGELHGLTRVRQFCLADAHIICMQEQIEKEFENVLDLIQFIMNTLGMKGYWYRFSKWDMANKKKYVNNPKAWGETQAIMKKILDKLKLKYVEAEGEAAFYGPKLDIQMKNVYGKEDTIFTVQIDFAMPERFDMTYEGEDGRKHRPFVVHRSSIGCFERTMAMLIEQYAGKFPLWLSPVQVKILSINERNIEFANDVERKLKENGIRVEANYKTETIQKKVRDAQLEKVPLMITMGDKEVEKKTLAVRTSDGKVKFDVKLDDFIKEVNLKIKEKSLE